MRSFGAGSAVAVFLWAVGCATSPPAIRPGVPFAAAADEQLLWQAGEGLDRELVENGLIREDAALNAYIERVAARLIGEGLAGTGLALRARVVSSPYRNAFVTPNGVLYVHTGLLCALDNEAQLATVVGHEIAHFTGRHGLREERSRDSYERAAKRSDAILDAAGGAGRLLDVATLGVGSLAIRVGLEASASGYSRDLEREADRVGFQYLASAGYDRAEGVRVFALLQEELVSEGIQEPFLFGSHPRLAERKESYFEMLEEDPGGEGDRNAEAYRSAIRAVLLANAELDLEIARPALALAWVERHLEIDPTSADGWYWMGELARRRRSNDALDEAVGHYRHALELDAAHRETLRALGLLFRERGRDDEAGPFFRRYLEADPGAVDRELVARYLEPPRDARAR